MLDLSRTQPETVTHETSRGIAIATLCVLVMGSQRVGLLPATERNLVQFEHFVCQKSGTARSVPLCISRFSFQNVFLESCLLGIEVAPTIGVEAAAHLGCGKTLGFLAVRKINRFGV